jgi:D-methionine transport system ATP-binding protein
MALVELREVVKEYPAASPGARGAARSITVVDRVSLAVEEGEVYGLIGYSGAGKSTIVRLINALTPVTSGSLRVFGEEVTTMREPELRRLRRGIGMVFQEFNLFSSRTVWRNVSYPLEIAKVPYEKQVKRVSELLRFVGLADKAHAWPEQLSGGQKQRVGIARALANAPKLLLADEATSALDPETTQEVLALLRRVNREFGTTIVVITHEMEVIRAIADRVGVLDAGRIVEEGAVYEVFSNPAHPVTRKFVSTVMNETPDAETLERLRERHDKLVCVQLQDGQSQAAVFGELARRGVGFELVHGGIETVQGRGFGRLTLALTGPPAVVSDAVEALASQIRIEEL